MLISIFLSQEAKAFPIALPVYSDFPVGYFLSYMFLCTCVFVVNVCVCGGGLGGCMEAKACS